MKARIVAAALIALVASPTLAQETRTPEAPTVTRIEWTAAPGAFERSLERRYGNPLFAPSRRYVSPEDHHAAVIRDAVESRAALEAFVDLALREGKLARLDDPAAIDDAVAEFEKQIRRARGIGGVASKLASELQKMRAELIATWRERNADSPEILVELDEIEQAIRRDAAIEGNDFVAQMLRKDGPIEAPDLAPSLLSEDLETIRLAIRQLAPQKRQTVRRDALAVVSTLRLEGRDVEGFDERLDALSRPVRLR